MHNMRTQTSKGSESLCTGLQRPAYIHKHQQNVRRAVSSKLSAQHRGSGLLCAALTLDAPQQQQQGAEQLAPQLQALGGFLVLYAALKIALGLKCDDVLSAVLHEVQRGVH